MYHLTQAKDIESLIEELTEAEILWVDTEVADYKTKKPRLSLIQVLANPNDLTGDRTAMLDVLDKPELVEIFIDKVMANAAIEKVFHNAPYDVKFLGGKKAVNVTCTLAMAKEIPYHFLPVSSFSLKSLTEYFTQFKNISKEEQGSDWGIRPLKKEQLEYAKMDCVYLCQIHRNLLTLHGKVKNELNLANITELGKRYLEIEKQWKLLNSEIEYIKETAKKAMAAQNLKETSIFKLSTSDRTTIKVEFEQLAKLAISENLNLDFPVTLTKEIQQQLGIYLAQLSTEEQKTTVASLKIKTEEEEVS